MASDDKSEADGFAAMYSDERGAASQVNLNTTPTLDAMSGILAKLQAAHVPIADLMDAVCRDGVAATKDARIITARELYLYGATLTATPKAAVPEEADWPARDAVPFVREAMVTPEMRRIGGDRLRECREMEVFHEQAAEAAYQDMHAVAPVELVPEGERIAVRERDEAYRYLRHIFEHIAPQCTPLPDLMGMCTQIDNALAGARKDLDQAAAAYHRKALEVNDLRTELIDAYRDVEDLRSDEARVRLVRKCDGLASAYYRHQEEIKDLRGQLEAARTRATEQCYGLAKLLTEARNERDGWKELHRNAEALRQEGIHQIMRLREDLASRDGRIAELDSELARRPAAFVDPEAEAKPNPYRDFNGDRRMIGR